ncbi:MAG: hypothetical protein FJ086_12125 [Deltaproteobacteria bacterium]|nr:hypothetical protein [Deltaproteobacteria bacterium]
MKPLAAVLLLLSALSGCESAVRCSTPCDCTEKTAPVKCPGEWTCQAGTCAYECRSPCTELPYTCGANQSCNGSICSDRPASCP